MTTKLSCSNCSQSLSEQDKFCVSCGHKIGMPSVRYHGLDALRGIAMLLGVVLHAALPYIPDVEAFWPADKNSSVTVTSSSLLLSFIINEIGFAGSPPIPVWVGIALACALSLYARIKLNRV